MKVGIITFHRAINYGAVLQTYALNYAIKELGAKCNVIDYRCPKIEQDRKIIKKGLSIKEMFVLFLQSYINIRKYKKFDKFIEKNISITNRKFYNKSDLLELNKEYDEFISGSDQVWSIICTDFDKNYFLDFVEENNKKNSYAASFGFEKIPDEYANEYKHLLEKFNNISVREKQGIRIVEELLNRSAEISLDPTFLLNKTEWSKIAKEVSIKNKYVLLYLMEVNRDIIKFAENFAASKNYELVYINSGGIRNRINAKYIRTAGPDEYLGLFKNAEYIITNSFHGVAFSINFNKNFYVSLQKAKNAANSRLDNILDILNLKDRLINLKEVEISEKAINYEEVNNKIAENREKSLNYLRNIITNK